MSKNDDFYEFEYFEGEILNMEESDEDRVRREAIRAARDEKLQRIEISTERALSHLESQSINAHRTAWGIDFEIGKGNKYLTIHLASDMMEEASSINYSDYEIFDKFAGYWNRKEDLIEAAIRPLSISVLEKFANTQLGDSGEDRDPSEYFRDTVIPGDFITLTSPRSDMSIKIGGCETAGRVLFGSMLNLPRTRFRRAGGTSGISIKIQGANLSDGEKAEDLLHEVVNHVSFQTCMRYGVEVSLPLRREKNRGLKRQDFQGGALEFPKQQFSSSPLSIYLSAMSRGMSPILRYWSFYQVIENYFPKYSNRAAIEEAAQIIRNPAFDIYDDDSISRLVRTAGRVGFNSSEKEQIKETILAIVSEDQMKEFLDCSNLGKVLNDKSSNVSSVNINVEHTRDLRGEIARRIYDIRCRIVHAKDGEDNFPNNPLIPGGFMDDVVDRELPIVKYLAEMVLIANSRPPVR